MVAESDSLDIIIRSERTINYYFIILIFLVHNFIATIAHFLELNIWIWIHVVHDSIELSKKKRIPKTCFCNSSGRGNIYCGSIVDN